MFPFHCKECRDGQQPQGVYAPVVGWRYQSKSQSLRWESRLQSYLAHTVFVYGGTLPFTHKCIVCVIKYQSRAASWKGHWSHRTYLGLTNSPWWKGIWNQPPPECWCGASAAHRSLSGRIRKRLWFWKESDVTLTVYFRFGQSVSKPSSSQLPSDTGRQTGTQKI